MSATLRSVSEEDVRRAAAIASWLAGYESATSRRTMGSSLRAIARTYYGLGPRDPVDVNLFAWEALDSVEFFSEVRRRLIERYGREHAVKYLLAMRSLLRHLAARDVADFDFSVQVLETMKVTRPLSDPPPLAFSSGDLFRLLQTCRYDPSTTTGLRDLAMISLAATTGARRHELVSIAMGELDLGRRTVELHVKGGGRRVAVLHCAAVDHLERWLETRGEDDGPLFPALRRGGHVTPTAVSDHQFWKILRRRCEEAGVEPVIAPHDLRRWFVTSLLESGVDVFQVARLVGHARVQTTLRYDRRPLSRMKEVVERLSVPLFADLEMIAPLPIEGVANPGARRQTDIIATRAARPTRDETPSVRVRERATPAR